MIDSSAPAYHDHRAGDFAIQYGQPHAYALYDFDTKVEGDLQFRAGDLLMLEDVVDEAWYRGHSVRTGQVGIFPMNHVEVKIALSTGLYTNAQPKPRIRAISDLKDSGKKTPITQATEPNRIVSNENRIQTNDNLFPANDLSFLPRRPSRVRVSSLRCKYDMTYQSLSPMFTSNTASAPNEPEDQTHSEKPDTSHIPLSRTPSIITSIRPRSQTSVSQLAQHLEQRGVTLNRMKSIPAGGRAIFPSSISPKSGPSPTPMEEPRSFPDYATSEGTGKRMITPSAYMVPTPLAMIAREQNRILGKGKLAPTEAYPTSTSSDPALAYSAMLKDRTRAGQLKNDNGVVVSTKSEIDLSRKSNQSDGVYHESPLSVNQPTRAHKPTGYAAEPYVHKDHSQANDRVSVNKAYMTENQSVSSTYPNKPALHQKPMLNYSGADIPSVLKSREDTLVHEDKRTYEEHGSYTETTEREYAKPTKYLQEYAVTMFNGSQNALPTAKESQESKQGPSTYVTRLTQELSSENSLATGTELRSGVNHAVSDLPDPSCCPKAPNSVPNLDPKQTDNFKEAIFSSLKNKNKNSEQWLYVSYDFFGTESGDLTVHAGTVLRCLDPLPPPAHANDLTIPERWLRCSTWYGQIGQVPSTFVRRILDPEELDGLLQYRPRAQALYDFTPEAKDDLQLQSGDILYLHEAVDSNWFRGESASTGQQGIFPISFVKVIYPL
ncbi:unnamed protein product [Echinostoma caproni]|uniref:SH3 domain-containing protein n=1 Tax=Echinostoma caproni TaxID=27848 RepID=A0A183A6S0_9TREM|nr:unnamed protein product [Echinostoma caproni]